MYFLSNIPVLCSPATHHTQLNNSNNINIGVWILIYLMRNFLSVHFSKISAVLQFPSALRSHTLSNNSPQHSVPTHCLTIPLRTPFPHTVSKFPSAHRSDTLSNNSPQHTVPTQWLTISLSTPFPYTVQQFPSALRSHTLSNNSPQHSVPTQHQKIPLSTRFPHTV
jgi:hypothetical protein